MSNGLEQSDGPRERSTYTSWDDDYKGFDAREDDNGKLSFLVVALAVGVVLVFGMVVWNTYRSDSGGEPNSAPVIRAETKDFKSRLEDNVASKPSGQNERLFDAVNPETNSSAPKVKTQPARDVVDGVPRDIRPNKPEIASTAPPKPKPKPVVRNTTETPPLPTNSVSRQTDDFRFDQTGQFLVQLSALRDVDAAQLAWSQMVESYPDLFSGAVMDIQRADLGAKGIFYRVRASAFTKRDDAVAFCDTLKARGESCIVAAR